MESLGEGLEILYLLVLGGACSQGGSRSWCCGARVPGEGPGLPTATGTRASPRVLRDGD